MKLEFRRFSRSWHFGIILLSATVLVFSGCGTSSAGPQPPPTPPQASVPTAGPTGGSNADKGNDLKRTNQGGSVTLEVTWDKAGSMSPGSPLRFTVAMDTHSVDLDSVDLSKLAVLRNESGKEVTPERWDAPKGGHHRSGTLVFPATVDSTPLIGPQTKSIELIVRDVAGVQERSFKWETGS